MGKELKKKRANLFLMAFLLLILLCLGNLVGYYYSLFLYIEKNTGSKEVVLNKPEQGQPINFLLLGLDNGGIEPDCEQVEKRSDVLLLLQYNPLKNKVNLVSIPRDTWITLKGKKDRINGAYAIGGAGYSISAVEELLGLKINYYISMDLEGFKNIVEGIGGVNITIPRNMNYDNELENLHVSFKKGEELCLKGESSEAFIKWRKNDDGTGFAVEELGRISNQQLLIKAFWEKLNSPAVILKLPNTIKTSIQHITTNLDAKTLLKYCSLFIRMNKGSFNYYALKGETTYTSNISYFLYQEEKNAELLAELGVDPTNIKDSNAPVYSNTLNKKNLRIKILNCTDKDGAAKTCGENLRKLGYNNITLGNGGNLDKSRFILLDKYDKYSYILKNDFAIDAVETVMKNEGNFDIIIMLGYDYLKLM